MLGNFRHVDDILGAAGNADEHHHVPRRHVCRYHRLHVAVGGSYDRHADSGKHAGKFHSRYGGVSHAECAYFLRVYHKLRYFEAFVVVEIAARFRYGVRHLQSHAAHDAVYGACVLPAQLLTEAELEVLKPLVPQPFAKAHYSRFRHFQAGGQLRDGKIHYVALFHFHHGIDKLFFRFGSHAPYGDHSVVSFPYHFPLRRHARQNRRHAFLSILIHFVAPCQCGFENLFHFLKMKSKTCRRKGEKFCPKRPTATKEQRTKNRRQLRLHAALWQRQH